MTFSGSDTSFSVSMFFKTSTLNEAVVVDWTIFVTKIFNKLRFALKVVALNKVRLKFLSSNLLTCALFFTNESPSFITLIIIPSERFETFTS